MADKKLMILGLGGVGSYAALLAGRFPGVKLYLGDMNEHFATHFANTVRYDVYFQNDSFRYPEVTGFGIDMTDTAGVEECIENIKPDVIFNATTLFSWWHVHRLPHNLARRLYYAKPEGSGLRPWAPGHGALLYNLMKAVKKCSPQTQVVNVSGPDYLHECLGKIGLAPTTGIGNVSLFEPVIKSIVAQQRNTSMAAINLTMVFHHIMCMQLFQEGSCPPELPFYLKIEEEGKDITEQFDLANDIWAKIPDHMPINNGVHQQFVAATAMQVVKNILFNLGELLHAPGPNGLPGGCPVRVDASGAKVVVPADLTEEKMKEIMYLSNYYEGFEPTLDDGTMQATPHCIQMVEETLGIDWEYKTVRPEQFMEAHTEISSKFLAFLDKIEKNS